MATCKGAVTSLRRGLLGDAPGRASRRPCHRARGTRTPGRRAPGSEPLGQRLRSGRETPCAPWGARPDARGRGRVAGDRRCSRGVRSSAGTGRSVDAGAARRRARRGSADASAPDPRGPQAPGARGAEAGQAAGLVSRFRDGSITARDAPARGRTAPHRIRHAPRRASSPKRRLSAQGRHPHRRAPASASSPQPPSPHSSLFFLAIAPSHHRQLHPRCARPFLRHENAQRLSTTERVIARLGVSGGRWIRRGLSVYPDDLGSSVSAGTASVNRLPSRLRSRRSQGLCQCQIRSSTARTTARRRIRPAGPTRA